MAAIVVNAAQVGVIYPESAEIFDVLPAETVTAGAAGYQVAASGKFGLAEADVAGKQQFRGLFLSKKGANQAVSLLKRGHVGGFDVSGLAYDAPVFLSNTPGALDTAAGTLSVQVGRVVAMPDDPKTKVIYIEADWLRAWA
jgi:hypothetical protein